MKKILLLCLCIADFSFASIEQHLKKAIGKGDNHSMRGIDFIYMINLDQRPEKFALSTKAFHEQGIYPYRFSAYNGWEELTLEIINDVGLKYEPGMTPLMATTYPMAAGGLPSSEFMTEFGTTYFCHCMSKGAIGIAMSHISVIKDAYDCGYETIWVMEDDVEVLGDLHTLSDLIDELDELVGKDGWDVLCTDVDYRLGVNKYLPAEGMQKRPDMDCDVDERYSYKYTVKENASKNFQQISARFGAHSMIIRRSGIEKLWEFAKAHQIFLPYDMENHIQPGIKRYALRYDLVTNMLNSLSDNGGAFYKDK